MYAPIINFTKSKWHKRRILHGENGFAEVSEIAAYKSEKNLVDLSKWSNKTIRK